MIYPSLSLPYSIFFRSLYHTWCQQFLQKEQTKYLSIYQTLTWPLKIFPQKFSYYSFDVLYTLNHSITSYLHNDSPKHTYTHMQRQWHREREIRSATKRKKERKEKNQDACHTFITKEKRSKAKQSKASQQLVNE